MYVLESVEESEALAPNVNLCIIITVWPLSKVVYYLYLCTEATLHIQRRSRRLVKAVGKGRLDYQGGGGGGVELRATPIMVLLINSCSYS